jgi:hypothetical protein
MNKRYNITLTLFFVLFVLAPLTSFSEEPVELDNSTMKFSKKECRQAVRWINNDLSLLMGSGILKKIVANKDNYNLYVGEGWYELEFEHRGYILINFSRSREIMRHSPFMNMFDYDSGEIVAAVSEDQIKIQFLDEGFFQYFSHGEKPEQTFY